jgi:hypothetical protein
MNEKLKIQMQQEQEENGSHWQTMAGLPQDEKESHNALSLPIPETAVRPSSIHRRYSPPRSGTGLSDTPYSNRPPRFSSASSSNLHIMGMSLILRNPTSLHCVPGENI